MTLPKLSLSGQVLLALVLGIAAGIFLGEAAASVEMVGDAFIRLLKMTVIPCIAVSLIRAIGGLDYATARQLALRGGAVLLVTFAIALLFVVALPFAFPKTVSASFFSSSLWQSGRPSTSSGSTSRRIRSSACGTIDALFQHWILGRAAEEKEPRWSVLHDVLHWGDSCAGRAVEAPSLHDTGLARLSRQVRIATLSNRV